MKDRINQAAIGIDVGGTNVQVALVNSRGEVYRKDRFPVAFVPTEQSFFKMLKTAIENIMNQFSDIRLKGIGIGTPGANTTEGTIEKASNLPWDKLPIVAFLKKEFLKPVYLTNDANLFAIGEKVFGKAADLNDFVVLTLGTGVGAGIYTGGKLLLGRDGLAGELGHVVVAKEGRQCHCGRKGCLERYVSASGLVLTAIELIEKGEKHSALSKLPADKLISSKVAEAAMEGDALALEAFQLTGAALGEALANIEASFNPEAIFLSGGLCKAGALLLEPAIQSFENNRLGIYPAGIPILLSSIPDDQAGTVGAAALVWDAAKELNRLENLSVN